jgi:crossover junction endodeoxyribonuclease RuvC
MKKIIDPHSIYFGVDLGKAGGLALIDADGEILDCQSMPDTPESIIKTIIEWTNEMIDSDADIKIYPIMEQVNAMPGEGVSSVFKFGYHCGGVFYMFETLRQMYPDNIMYAVRIAPILWKKKFKLINSELSKYEKKKASVDYANELFSLEIRYTDNGIAEAILIAEYLRLDAMEKHESVCTD